MDRFLSLLLLIGLAACGEPADPQAVLMVRDPAIMGALSEPLMSDPDLAGASRSDTVLAGGGMVDGGLPLFGPDDKEAERARAEANAMFEGSIPPAPPPQDGPKQSKLAGIDTAAGVAAAVPFAARCTSTFSYGFGWAAQLPEAAPIYPRAHVQEAGGSDQQGCKLRVVNFRTPVAVRDVIDFYYAAAASLDLKVAVATAGEDQVVTGGGNGVAFTVHVRRMANGMTEADLVTNG